MGGLTSIHGPSVLWVTTRKAALAVSTGCLPGRNNRLQISTTRCGLKLGGKARTDFLWSFVQSSCCGAATSVQQSLDWMSNRILLSLSPIENKFSAKWQLPSQRDGARLMAGYWQRKHGRRTADRSGTSALLQGNRSLQRKSVCCAASRSSAASSDVCSLTGCREPNLINTMSAPTCCTEINSRSPVTGEHRKKAQIFQLILQQMV